MKRDVAADVNAVADHLRLCIQARRITLRAVERELGMGAGYLGQLLRGNLDLKLKHLMAVLRVIGMEPEEFFASLYSGTFPVASARPAAMRSARPQTWPDEVVPGLSEARLDEVVTQALRRLGFPKGRAQDEEEISPLHGRRSRKVR